MLPDSQKLALSPLTIADEPLWVLHCLLLIMVNGTKSANFRTFQEAASLTSLLIEVRVSKLKNSLFRGCPCASICLASEDIYLPSNPGGSGSARVKLLINDHT